MPKIRIVERHELIDFFSLNPYLNWLQVLFYVNDLPSHTSPTARLKKPVAKKRFFDYLTCRFKKVTFP